MTFIKRLFMFLISILIFFSISNAQHFADLLSKNIIDKPSESMNEAKSLVINSEVYSPGGLLIEASYGITDRLTAGLSYGGWNIIGYGDMEFNKKPGFYAKLKVLEDEFTCPSVCIGIETQGKGIYNEFYERYQVKSPGLFVVASKEFDWAGSFKFSGGVTYSLENKDSKSINPYVGVQKNIGQMFLFNTEFDFALNDNDKKYYGQGKVYLNIGCVIRLFEDKNTNLVFNLKDLLKNNKAEKSGRSIGLTYWWVF